MNEKKMFVALSAIPADKSIEDKDIDGNLVPSKMLDMLCYEHLVEKGLHVNPDGNACLVMYRRTAYGNIWLRNYRNQWWMWRVTCAGLLFAAVASFPVWVGWVKCLLQLLP